ncbi:MAG: HNH endonuclease [Actinomycetota bacterium]|nr:HNH endonuclease [Actinomycetota bacterium]
MFEAAMREARDALFHAGNPQVDRIDALIETCHRSLDTIPDGSRRDRYRINLYVNVDGTATFADNWHIPDPIRQRLFCDGTITPVGLVGGIPVNVGHSQHIVPDRTRRLVEHRDLGCRVPGCTQTRWMQVHHIVHWTPDDGPTDTWNLICLCPRHHRMHHQHILGIQGNADLPTGTPGAVEFTDAKGHRMKPAADPTTPTSPPPTPAGSYAHPLGERLDRWAIHFNEPPTGGSAPLVPAS